MNETWVLDSNELSPGEFKDFWSAKKAGKPFTLRGKRWLVKELRERWSPGGMWTGTITLVRSND